MKTIISTLMMSVVCMLGASQSESNVRNLMIGDTLLVATDRLPSNRRIAIPSSGNYWNFRSLKAPYTRLVLVRVNKMPGLNADLIISEIDGIDYFIADRDGDLLITAMKIKDNGVEWFGRVRGDLPYRLYGVEEGDTSTFSGSIVFARQASSKLGDPVSADSVRLTVSWEQRLTRDMTGRLDLESGLFEANRYTLVKSVSYLSQARFSGRWTPWKYDVEQSMPPVLQNGITYAWWNSRTPEFLAYVHADKYGSAKSVMFRASPSASRKVVDGAPSTPDIFVNPNPTFGFVRFELVNLPKDVYRIELYNIIGVMIREIEVEVDGRLTMPVDLSDLKRGTYIYRLVNSSMGTIRSKRLVILTP